MRKNFYNIKLKESAASSTTIVTPGGIDIGTPDGGVIGTPDGTVASLTMGYRFYNVQLEKIWYYLLCSGGDNLQCSSGSYLTAHNVS